MIEKTINTRFGIATLNKNGYYEVERNGKKVNLHKLIYLANNGEIPEGYTIHHKNGVKTDNDPRNLVAMPKRYHKLVHDGYNDKSQRGVKMNNKKLCKTIEKLQEGLNFARAELKELRENNERYSDTVTEKELTIAEKEKVIREKEILINENERLIAEKEKEILEYEKRIEKLLKENEQLINENKELTERSNELRLVLLDVQSLLQEAEDEITILNYEVKNKEKEILEYKEKLLGTQEELSGTKEELSGTKEELSETKGVLNETLDELKQISKENKELKTELEADRERMDGLDVLLNDLQDEIDEIITEETDLQTETEELVEDINNLKNSTFGLSEAAYNSLPEATKAEFKRNATKAIELRLVDIRVRFDNLKGRHGELQALYNGITRRRQKLQLNGKL